MNQELQIQLSKEIPRYSHKISGTVKFHEVDLAGFVHNIQYLYYFEYARTEYMKNLGFKLDSRNFMKELPLMVVHSEIDYYSPAGFGDEYEIYTRISKIGKTSITFENIIRLKNGIILAKGIAVLVYFDSNTFHSTEIPDNYKKMIIDYELDEIEITHY